MQAGFDDGGTGNASITCVAGYFFRDDVLSDFRSEWRRLLNGRRFRMVNLVHGHKDFEDLDEPQRDELARGLIAAIKQHMTLGVVVSVERAAYDKCIAMHGDDIRSVGRPFGLCATLCLGYSARWMEEQQMPPEETIYFFESGSSNQADANKFLNSIPDNSALDERYRYVSHGFIKKNKLAALDAADLLAWEWIQQCKRLSGQEKRPTRASLRSLCERPHVGEHFDGKNMELAFARALLEPFVVPAQYPPLFVRPEPRDKE
ncbi:MAG: hypothetical protein ABSD63_09115 [Candidatus Korobacteraceae bacterium]|jgi:hypothetical protein